MSWISYYPLMERLILNHVPVMQILEEIRFESYNVHLYNMRKYFKKIDIYTDILYPVFKLTKAL